MPDVHHPNPDKQSIIDKTIQAGQDHVFHWWNDLDDNEKKSLIDQLATIDFDELAELYRHHKETGPSVPDSRIEPAEVIPFPKDKRQAEDAAKAAEIGGQAIREGSVAVFVVAGGQATRLGFDAPKGTYKITPIKKKTLLQHHVEKIRALSIRYDAKLPFYVMTSETNDDATRAFFEDNKFFGLDSKDVFFFKQEMIPAIDLEGKLILDAKNHIFTNPNGHGGSISSLYNSGALADMQNRGLKHIFYFQVDNVLIKIADPIFLGHHISRNADMSDKVAPKRDPEEKVGVVCNIGDKLGVIEYSDLPDEYKYARNEDGSLKFSPGNLAIHILDVDFVQRLNEEKHSLPFHIAQKAVPYIDDGGQLVKPEEKNGIKFEKFVFDALGRAKAAAIMEVDRNEEFAPVKNAEGEDSPQSARELMARLYAKWLEEAGMQLPDENDAPLDSQLEISPLYALDAKELRNKLPASFKVKLPLYLGPE